MKRKTFTMLTVVVMALLCVIGMAACDDNDGSIEAQGETVLVSIGLDWESDGNYSGEAVLGSDYELGTTTFDKADFTLSASDSSAEQTERTLSDFTVTAKDSKTVAFTFKAPTANADLSYVLLSNKAVCSGNSQLGIMIFINDPQVGVENFTYFGAYPDSDKIVATVELEKDAEFVLGLSTTMFDVPAQVGEVLAVDRISGKKAVVTVGNLAKNFSSEYFYMSLNAAAVNSQFAKDESLCVDFVQPQITLSDVSYDGDTHVVTVGKAAIPSGLSGSANGVSAYDDAMISIVAQSYNSQDNYYAFSLKLNDDALAIYGEEALLDVAYANIKIVSERETFDYRLNPYLFKATLIGNTEIDIVNDKINISLKVVSGKYVDGLTLGDFSISGAESLTNLRLKSVDKEKITFEADYTEANENATTIRVDLDNSKVLSTYGDEDYSAVIFIPPYADGRAIGDDVCGKLPYKIMANVGSRLSSLNAGHILPYVLDSFDFDTSDKNVTEVSAALLSLQTAVDALLREVKNDVDVVDSAVHQAILANYFKASEKVNIGTNQILSSESAANYLLSQSSARAQNMQNFESTEAYYDWLQAKNDYEKFAAYAADCRVTSSPLGDMRQLYNGFVRIIRLYGKERLDLLIESMYVHNADDGNYLDREKVYELCVGKQDFNAIQNFATVSGAATDDFVAAVGSVNAASEYVKSVFALGEKMLSTSNEFESEIFSLYYDYLDSIFNFGSQTLQQKNAFASYSYANYIIGAALAIEYAEQSGDSEYGAKLRAQSAEVLRKISASYRKSACLFGKTNYSDILETHFDLLLVTGGLYYRNLQNYEMQTRMYLYECDVLLQRCFPVSYKQMETMISRASKRGVSLAQDLINAGFTGVNPTYVGSSEYIFACDGGRLVRNEFFKRATVPEISQKIAQEHYVPICYCITDIVSQTGMSAPVIRKDEMIAMWVAGQPETSISSTFSCAAVSRYGLILGFSFTKQFKYFGE